MNEMKEQLKNKIRCERIRELLNAVVKRDYSPMTIEKVKDITKEDILETRKRDCIKFLINLKAYIKNTDTIIESFKEMDIDDVLLLTYRINLLYNIILYEHSNESVNQTLNIDQLEEKLVILAEKKELDKLEKGQESKKNWWDVLTSSKHV